MRLVKLMVFFVVLILLMLTACSARDKIMDISKLLDVDLSSGTVVHNTDSHGGFHYDGDSYVEITFADDETIIEDIKNAKGWNELPMTDHLNTAVYGKISTSENVEPYVSIDDKKALFSDTNNGYYFFYDRHSDSKDVKDDTDLLTRYSLNFTIAMYDCNTKTLYYYELDT